MRDQGNREQGDHDSDGRYQDGWKELQRRKMLIVVTFASFPLYTVVLLGIHYSSLLPDSGQIIGAVWSLLSLVWFFVAVPGSLIWMTIWRCPRCKKRFFVQDFVPYWLDNRTCRHCDLRRPQGT